MSDLVSRLSELRSQYSCFDETERDAYHTLSEAIEALQKQKTGEWIPCSERLPEYDKDVLCYTDAEEFIVGYRVDNWGQDAWITGEFGNGEFNAIAWMPLPEPMRLENES